MSENIMQQPAVLYAPQPKISTFTADKADKLFALLYLLIGYAYVRIQIDLRWHFDYAGIFLTLFVLLYAASVVGYIYAKGKRLTRTGIFWLCILLALGLSYTLFENRLLFGVQGLALHLTAAYFTLTACGASLLPHTSCFLPFDIFNALIIVPFSNFFARIRTLYGCVKGSRLDKKRVGSILLGAVLLAAALVLIVPQLMQADKSFNLMLSSFRFDLIWNSDEVFYILLSLPVGAYLYGLAFGSVNKRHTGAFGIDMLQRSDKARHVVPQNTVYIVLGGVAALYVLFIAVQSRSIFSAFEGRLYGTQVYSEYAREGFFSLCRVAVINAALIFAADLFAKASRAQSKILRVFNVVFSALTLILLASALAKMLLYIDAYGLTSKRILTLWLMAALAVLFVSVIVWQFKNIDVIRITACTAAVLFCLLALCNIDAVTDRFNAAYEVQTEAAEVLFD